MISNNKGTYVLSGAQHLTLDARASYDLDGGGIASYRWYLNGSTTHSSTSTTWYSYYPVGTHEVKLKVTDHEGSTDELTVTIEVKSSLAGTKYYITDHLGSVRSTVNHLGQVVGQEDFSQRDRWSYGLTMPGRSWNNGNAYDRYKFTGVERDSEGGLELDAFGSRNYDPELGMFLGVDRYSDKYPNISTYQYAANNPINKYDLNGDSIVVLLQHAAALGAGHMATLTQNSDGMWVYQSKNGGVLLVSGESDSPEQELFDSISEFVNSEFNLTPEGEQRYNEALLLPSDPKDGDGLVSATKIRLTSDYILGADDCSHTAQTSVKMAGFNDGSTSWRSVSTGTRLPGVLPISNLTPKAKFAEIKKSNESAIDISNQIQRD